MKLHTTTVISIIVVLVVASFITFNVASYMTRSESSDWIVVQYGCNGSPINAWKLQGVKVVDDGYSDGIYWHNEDGGITQIAGFHLRTQVRDGRFSETAEALGIELNRIQNGKYNRR
jgi:hypothetical protein